MQISFSFCQVSHLQDIKEWFRGSSVVRFVSNNENLAETHAFYRFNNTSTFTTSRNADGRSRPLKKNAILWRGQGQGPLWQLCRIHCAVFLFNDSKVFLAVALSSLLCA